MSTEKEFIQPPAEVTSTNFSSDIETNSEEGGFLSGPFSGTGIACGNIEEPIPEFKKADCELVIRNRNNAWIVLGRDRPGNRASGYAAIPFAYNTGMIDMVVGRGGPSPRAIDDNGETNWVDPNFSADAARIYISQTTNIDRNFGINEEIEEAEKKGITLKASAGTFTFSSVGKSAIGIKADHVRLIGRENIKIVTRGDDRNSKGQVLEKKGKIMLIANNYIGTLQPMVLGYNLKEYLEKLNAEIRSIKDALYAFQKFQDGFNQAVAPHTHLSNYWGKEVKDDTNLKVKSFKTQMDLFQFIAQSCTAIETNITGLENTYLTPNAEFNGILSAWCFAN